MMKKRPPLRITVRLAEPGIVVREAAPADEEQVASRALDARPHLEPKKSVARGNQRQRLVKGSLESCRLARPDLENRVLEDHDQEIVWPVFFQSARKFSRPLSVSGCRARLWSTAGGIVATSAPAIAAWVTWSDVRIDAAKISVFRVS